MSENPGADVVQQVENPLLYGLRARLGGEMEPGELEALSRTIITDMEETINSAAGVSVPDQPGGRVAPDGSGGEHHVQ